MKGRIVLLAAAGLAAWIVGLAATLPADRALAWFAPDGVEARGVMGTAWQGRAARIDTAAGVPVHDVRWDASAWRLLTGTVAADARFRLAGLEVDGRFARGPGGSLHGRDITVRGPVGGLAPLFPGLPVAFTGDLLARIEAVGVDAGRIVALAGRLQWSDARVNALSQVTLGRVRATIEPAGDRPGFRVNLEGGGGDLDIDGRVRLEPDGRYRADLELAPTPDAPGGLRETLGLVAQPDGDAFRLRRSGELRLPGD